MLTHLAIRNLGLIESLAVEPGAGLTVITGETGAGKSMVMDALTLALGGRAEAGLLRAGETTCEVSATFSLPPDAALETLLESHGLSPEDGHLILRRQLRREAKGASSRAWVGATPVPVGVLEQLGAHLVDIHGQHGTLELLTPTAQRDMLDAFAAHPKLTAAAAHAFAAWKEAHGGLADARATATRLAEETGLRAAWLKELAKLAYQPGEEETLMHTKHRLANLGQIRQQLETTDHALNDDKAALHATALAARNLNAAAAVDEALKPLSSRLDTLLEDLRDIAYEASRAAGNLEGGGADPETIDDRLHAIRACARKHHVTPLELPQVEERLLSEQKLALSAEDNVHGLEKAERAARDTFAKACAALTASRQKALPALHEKLHAALAHLLMPHAKVQVQLFAEKEENCNKNGAETVSVMLAANPGQPLQPLAKVASGGELSRLMLALKTVFAAGLSPRTLVLDEIDSGLSGAAASAVGAAMAGLGAHHQVIAISHHAQVAAQAAAHWKVAKSTAGGTTTTQLLPLGHAAREDELARLLSGATITEAARAAAQSLLAEGRRHAA